MENCLGLCRFEHVPLVTPNGDVLVNELNFEVCILCCGAVPLSFLGRLFDKVDLIKAVSNVHSSVWAYVHAYVRACVHPSVHKTFLRFH